MQNISKKFNNIKKKNYINHIFVLNSKYHFTGYRLQQQKIGYNRIID